MTAVEPVLDLDALERAIVESLPGLWYPQDRRPVRIAAAVERHVAPIITAARQSTAFVPRFSVATATPVNPDPFGRVTFAPWTPPTPAGLAKDPKVAAAVLRAEAVALGRRTHEARGEYAQQAIDWMVERADELDAPEPADPLKVAGQIREWDDELFRCNGRIWVCMTNSYRIRSADELRGCRVVSAAEVRDRLGLDGDR